MAHPMTQTVIPFAFPGLPQVGVAFTTVRTGNVSHAVGGDPAQVEASRIALKQGLGFGSWHSLRQVHGVGMAYDAPASPVGQPSGVEADGQATDKPGRALVIKTADCQPLLLAHESGRYVAGLHVGWRGNVQEFPQIGVRAFCERYGLKPGELFAVRGPSLGPGASEFTNFDMEFGDRFRDFFDPVSRRVSSPTGGRKIWGGRPALSGYGRAEAGVFGWGGAAPRSSGIRLRQKPKRCTVPP